MFKIKNNVLSINIENLLTEQKIETDQYEIIIKVNKKQEKTDNIYYKKLLEENTELMNIINVPFVYGESLLYDFKTIISLLWIYKFIYNNNVIIFLPKYLNNHFYDLIDNNIKICNGDLESLETLSFQKNDKIVFLHSHILFNDISKTNKRRLNTILNNGLKKGNIQILSPVLLNSLEIKALSAPDALKKYNIKTNFNLKNIIDRISCFDFDEQTLISIVEDYIAKNKRIYLSLNLSNSNLLKLEKQLQDVLKSSTLSRTDNDHSNIVINSSKTFKNTFLKSKYDVYILLLPSIMDSVEYIDCFKFMNEECTSDILVDETNIRSIKRHFKILSNESLKLSLTVKDSKEYSSYSEITEQLKESEPILATDYYYSLTPENEDIKNMNLSNLTKNDYNTIRDYVKNKLNNKFDISVKTCQLVTPSSPKDRAKKLNSLSNKISSIDYRCDCTCEIFKDYSIGVLVWNELFSQKNELKLNNNDIFVYQTTTGAWKFSKIN